MILKFSIKLTLLLIIFMSIFTPYLYVKANESYDLNKDGKIDSDDLDMIANNFSTNKEEYDINKDGIVDIIDLTIVAKSIESNNPKPEISQGSLSVFVSDNLIKSFDKNMLVDAISFTSKNNGILKFEDKIIWDKNSYFIYSDTDFNKSFNTLKEAINHAYTVENSFVTSKSGNVIYNKNLNYRKIIGISRTDINLRYAPDMDARSDNVIPNKTMLEVIDIINGFYKVAYYPTPDNLLVGYIPSYIDIIQDDINESQLGYISAREESNGDPGVVGVNPNDKGGASFGVWQLSSEMGSVDEFIDYIENLNNEIYNRLITAKENDNDSFGEIFINEWKQIAIDHYNTFYELQRLFIKSNYFDSLIPLANKNNLNIDFLMNFNSTKNMLWSSSVHHGPLGLIRLIQKIPSQLTIEDFISMLYEERLKIIEKSYPPDSPNPGVVSIYNGIKERFLKEEEEIIRIYNYELSK